MDFRKKIILLSLFLLFCYLFLIFLPLRKTFKNIFEKEREVLNLKKEEISILENFKQLKEIGKEREKIEKVKKALFDPKNPVPFIELVENLAKEEDLEFSLNSREDKKEKNKVIFSVSFAGELENIFDFLRNLENSPYFLRIESLKISKGKEKIQGVVDFVVFSKISEEEKIKNR